MAGLPIALRAPATLRASDGASPVASFDLADPKGCLACFGQRLEHGVHFVRMDCQHHADPAIERARHFFRLDVPLRLQESHQAGLLPCTRINLGMSAIGQNARDILEQSAARDMRQCVDLAGADERQKAGDINAGRRNQRVDQQAFGIKQGRAVKLPPLILGQSAHQRIAVGMHARAGQPDQHMARGNSVTRQLLAALNRAYAKSSEVIIASCIHARHFRRLAADQRAARLLAAISDARNHTLCNPVFELSSGKIIEEEQRFCALHDQIIDAHCNQINADRVVAIMVNREFDLGSDAVIRCHQQRVIVTSCLGIEKAAKSANLAIRASTGGGLDQGANRLDQSIASGNRYSCAFIGVAGRIFVLCGHNLQALAFRAWNSIAHSAKGGWFSPMQQQLSTVIQRKLSSSAATFRQTRVALWAGGAVASVAAVLAFVPGSPFAQVEGDRGIAPIVSSSDIDVAGIDVDVRGKNAEEARQKGWEEAQRKAWAKIDGPKLSDDQLDSLVSAIVIEREQVGPRRYIARLGVIFDRVRAGRYLGSSKRGRNSAPMLLLPVTKSGGTYLMYEKRNPWQRAWAEYQSGGSRIDYVRPSGAGGDSLLLTYGQTSRRSRLWWNNILDNYEASGVLVPTAEVNYSWPGGPIEVEFSARYGPDSTYLDGFTMKARNARELPDLYNKAVLQFDEMFAKALADGKLKTDPTIGSAFGGADPAIQRLIEIGRAAQRREQQQAAEARRKKREDTSSNNRRNERSERTERNNNTPTPTATSTPTPTPTPTEAAPTVSSFTVQFSTPDPGAFDSILGSVRSASGVRGVATTSMAIGGTSVMSVSYAGSIGELASALRARGFNVQQGANALSISR